MKRSPTINLLLLICLGLLIILVCLLIATPAQPQDADVEEGYTVWNIPNVEKLKVCSPDPLLWIIPHWGDCKIVDVQRLIDFVAVIGEEVPKTTTTSTIMVYPIKPWQ